MTMKFTTSRIEKLLLVDRLGPVLRRQKGLQR
jgi:hypothetical protein